MAATLSHHDGFYYGEHTGEFIEIQALRIHITYAGEGDPVLLIHGAGQNSYTWRHQFEALAERYFVVAVDMIGYGYSDKPDLTYTIEENSEFLLALLNTLRIKQTNIIAMGSGATYALDFMVHYPDRVHRAICSAPGGVTDSMPLPLRLMQSSTFGWLGKALFSERKFNSMISNCMFDQTCLSSQDLSIYYETMDSKESREVLRRSIANFQEDDVLYNLRLLPHEVLFVWGSEDRWRPIADAGLYTAPIENYALYEMRNCGHLPHEEKPDKFNENALYFLRYGLDG